MEAAIISIAQQAKPKPNGQTEFLRPQLYRSSSVVVKTPCFCNSLLNSSSMLFPSQHALPPGPEQAGNQHENENHHFHKSERAQSVKRHRERQKKNRFDVEDQKNDCVK